MNSSRVIGRLVCVVVSYGAATQTAYSQNLSDQWVEKAARSLVDKKVVDGLSIGYLEGDHYGSVHLGLAKVNKKPDNLTIYEIGSVSKVLTSLMLADAVERGEIDFDAVAEVSNEAAMKLPSRNGASIKWIDLATHRSGLPRLADNMSPMNAKNPYQIYDSKRAAEFLKGYPLPRQPGESQEYSNLGVSVLGYLVAQKAGATYQQVLRDRIAKPLKMDDLTVSLTAEQKERFATPHDKFGSSTLAWTFADMPGAGGVHATMRDMMRFAKAQLNPPAGEIGNAIELAWKKQREADASGQAMGLGWFIAGDGQTRWHNGQTGGSTAAVFINREFKSAVIILCNTSVSDTLEPLAAKLIQKAAGQEPAIEEEADTSAKDSTIDAKFRSRLVGRYQLNPNFIFTVEDKDGHLIVGITNQPTQEVFPDSPTRWSYKGVNATLEFKLGKGQATSLILHQNGLKQTANRIK